MVTQLINSNSTLVLPEDFFRKAIELNAIVPFFIEKKNVKALYRDLDVNSTTELRYLVVLKEDNIKTRKEIRSFFSEYDFNNFEVFFMFVPESAISEFTKIQKVVL